MVAVQPSATAGLTWLQSDARVHAFFLPSRGRRSPVNLIIRHHINRYIVAVLLILLVIILLCAAVAAAGLWIQRQVASRSPNNRFLDRVTPTGLILSVLPAGTLLMIAVVRHVTPDTYIGALLRSDVSALIVAVMACVISACIAIALQSLGYPPFKPRGHRDA
jgi:hypothetical protein